MKAPAWAASKKKPLTRLWIKTFHASQKHKNKKESQNWGNYSNSASFIPHGGEGGGEFLLKGIMQYLVQAAEVCKTPPA